MAEAEINLAKQTLISEIEEQYKTLFEIEAVGFEERQSNLIKKEVQKVYDYSKSELGKIRKDLSEKMENLVLEEFEDLKNELAALKAGRINVESALQEDIQFLTDKFAELNTNNEQLILEKFEEYKNSFCPTQPPQNQLARQETVTSFFANTLSAKDLKVQVPTFRGTERPLVFLKQFKNYCDRLNLEFFDVKLHLQSALQDAAANWYTLNEDKIFSWEEFEEQFKEYF